MRHATDENILFEVFCNELRSIIANNTRLDVGVFFASPLQYDFDVHFEHLLAKNTPTSSLVLLVIMDCNSLQKISNSIFYQWHDACVNFALLSAK